jgi:hypothetical protein
VVGAFSADAPLVERLGDRAPEHDGEPVIELGSCLAMHVVAVTRPSESVAERADADRQREGPRVVSAPRLQVRIAESRETP